MVELAANTGFCFGVKRSVDMVNDLLTKGRQVYTLGEIIHNRQVCENLKLKGVKIVNELEISKLSSEVNLIFRSHGVGRDVYNMCRKFKVKYFDATCPFVKKIHEIVFQHSNQGRIILIVGDKNHPEVKAIQKYCVGEVFVFLNFDLILEFLKRTRGLFTLVAQTTYSDYLWTQGVQKIANFSNVKIFKTICNSTIKRQKSAMELAKKVDFMVVVGDRKSSNSKKLFELCSKFCRSCFVEDKLEFDSVLERNLHGGRIGIAAGASTPPEVVKDIFSFLKCLFD